MARRIIVDSNSWTGRDGEGVSLADVIGNIRYGLSWGEPLIAYEPPAWWVRWRAAR